MIFCETTWRGRASCQATHSTISPTGSREQFLSCHVIWTAVYINIYSLILTGAQSPSIILGKHLHQRFCGLVSVCVFLIGSEELNCLAFEIIEIFSVRFACTNPAHEKRAICMTKGGRVTRLMTFTHLACQAMWRRIRFEQRHRSLLFIGLFFIASS